MNTAMNEAAGAIRDQINMLMNGYEDILLDRIVMRAQQARERGGAVRADDNRESLKIRLDAYNQETAPLVEYDSSYRLLRTIDGLQSIDDVTKSIFAALRGVSS